MSELSVVTAIPLNYRLGSGCYIGTTTLVDSLTRLGISVDLITPNLITPVYTATRLLFNESLRRRRFHADATIGIDADGYALPRGPNAPPHIACIKGVLGDAVRFETGITRASLAFHARLEAAHARRAGLVITVSRYCAERLEELYGVKNAVVVPELIDLHAWRQRFLQTPAVPDPQRFTVLSVCRFYPRKRLCVLLRAAALLRNSIPELEIRIVGNGLESKRLHRLASELKLDTVVRWLGDTPVSELAAEYKRCDVFCLPSVQEGFGIVFLEAMAAAKPIVAARAAAVPEVVRDGILVEPDNPEALAEGIVRLYRNPGVRTSLGIAGSRTVEQFAADRVAQRFLAHISQVAPRLGKMAVPQSG